ncbi:MAG TPA: hypothetical protein VLG37_04665 [Candidatus Saccharimonadales bacterium]|nr:hypothetical protein [Candidatus Saccharimonadales bacterium]
MTHGPELQSEPMDPQMHPEIQNYREGTWIKDPIEAEHMAHAMKQDTEDAMAVGKIAERIRTEYRQYTDEHPETLEWAIPKPAPSFLPHAVRRAIYFKREQNHNYYPNEDNKARGLRTEVKHLAVSQRNLERRASKAADNVQEQYRQAKRNGIV